MPHVFPWLSTATPLAAVVVGLVLLLFGRRLFWLFVGVVGFMAGWYFALGNWHHAPAGGQLVVAIVAGLIGIVLALMLQKVAVAVAGFVVGWSFVASLLGWQMTMLRPGQLLVLAVAGVVAAVLALVVFDFALILYSSLAGASLIVDHVQLHLGSSARLVLLVVLVVVGIAVQSRWLDRGRVRRV
jgi:hypothetical protein